MLDSAMIDSNGLPTINAAPRKNSSSPSTEDYICDNWGQNQDDWEF